MGVTTRGHARQKAEKTDSTSSTSQRMHKNTKNTKIKATKSSRSSRQVKPRNKTVSTAPPVETDDRSGIIFPMEGAGLDSIVAILDGAKATYKVNWMTSTNYGKYINCIWFNLVTRDTMAQLLASVCLPFPLFPSSSVLPVRRTNRQTDVKRAFFYKEEDERLIQQGVEDLVEGRGWFREDEYDSDI